MTNGNLYLMNIVLFVKLEEKKEVIYSVIKLNAMKYLSSSNGTLWKMLKNSMSQRI